MASHQREIMKSTLVVQGAQDFVSASVGGRFCTVQSRSQILTRFDLIHRYE